MYIDLTLRAKRDTEIRVEDKRSPYKSENGIFQNKKLAESYGAGEQLA